MSPSTQKRIGDPSSPSRTLSTNLPLDTLIVLMSYLEPVDIVACRLTCKRLYETTQRRVVWIDALKRMCIEQEIYEGTFQEELMTLDQLIKAVTGCSRFMHLLETGSVSKVGSIENNPGEPIQPISTRVLRTQYVQGIQDKFIHFNLVPGGRFVITRSDQKLMQLWDLGNEPNAILRRTPLATMEVEGSTTFAVDTLCSPNQGLLVMFHSEGPTNLFSMVEIHPLSPTPEFRPVTSLCLPSDLIYAFALFPRICVFHYPNGLIVWNYEDNTWGRVGILGDARETFVSDGHIVALDDNMISVWKLPEMYPVTDGVYPQSKLSSPLSCIPHPHHTIHRAPWRTPWRLGISPNKRTLHFDISGDPDPVNCTAHVSRYIVKGLGDTRPEGLPPFLPILAEEFDVKVNPDPNMLHYGSIGTSDGHLLLTWSEGPVLYVDHSRYPSFGIPSQHRLSKLAASQSYDEYALMCTVSGRVCVISEDNNLHVMDYV